jgi:hypothetical protein
VIPKATPLVRLGAIGVYSPLAGLTERGMTVGSRVVATPGTPCAVFVGARVNWLWTSQVLGFEPKLVHFRETTSLVLLVRRLFPDARIVVGSHGALLGFDLPKVAFVHGSVGSFSFLFDKVDVIVATQGKRGKAPIDWELSKTRVAHSRVGGVTNTTDNCYLWTRSHRRNSAAEIPVPTALPRDVHSVVSDTVCGAVSGKPVASRMHTPQVLETRPGVYHGGGGGLLPLDHMNGQFEVRSVFTPTKWCRRRL